MLVRQQKGRLDVITGCMSSGKSERLIWTLKREQIAHENVVVFKPSRDTRSQANEISSRDGKSFEAINVASPGDIVAHIRDDHGVVGLDEVQFFDETDELRGAFLDVVLALLEQGKRVVVAGLNQDFLGQPFLLMAHLLAMADDIQHVKAVCVVCHSREATMSQRLINGEPAPRHAQRIVVGGNELYEARCRSCHTIPG
jgi:thymidine kinase